MATQALMVMDVQEGIVERYREQAEPILGPLARAVAGARASGVPAIHVRVAFRPDAPEISPRNRTFAPLRGSAMGEDDPATAVHPAVAPRAGEIVVTKRRVSAFSGSDLDVVLRSLGVDALALTGVATSGVVLSTLRQAADLDFELTVLADCCADTDPEVHRVLLERVFPRQATISTADQWVADLPGGGQV